MEQIEDRQGYDALQEEIRAEREALATMKLPDSDPYKGIGPMLELYADDIDKMEVPLRVLMQTLKELCDQPLVQQGLIDESKLVERNFVESTLHTLRSFEKTLTPFSVYMRSTARLLDSGHPLRHEEFKGYVENAIAFLDEYLMTLEKQHKVGQTLLEGGVDPESAYVYAPVKFLTEALQAHPGSHLRSASALKMMLQSVGGLIMTSFIPSEEPIASQEAPVQLDPELAALLGH